MPAPIKPTPIKFGYYLDEANDAPLLDAPQYFDGETPVVVFGVMGAGKSTRFLIENLAWQLRGRSIVVFDMKAELLAQTQRARLLYGDVKIVNPYNLHNLGSDGYNLLAGIDPDSDEFFDRCKAITQGIIEVEGDSNKFFPQSAQGWLCCGVMWEVMQAKPEDRPASILRARQWCLEPETVDEKGKPTKGIRFNAKQAHAVGGVIANLAVRFARDEPLTKGDQDVLQTLNVETEFLISPPIMRDLEKGNWTFDQLKERPTTVYICLPPNQVNDKRRWTRALITQALYAHLKPGPVRTLFILDEFRVSIGHLQIVNEFWSLVRGYGVQFMPILQSVTQLKALFKDEWENYAGQAGAIVTLGPAGDRTTAEWMSKRSGQKTVWIQGYGEGIGQSASGASTSDNENMSQKGVPVRTPEQLMSLPKGTGIIWWQGMGDLSTPFCAPNYWKRAEVAPLVDENPYYAAMMGGAPAKSASAGKRRKTGRLAIAFAIGWFIGAWVLFGH